MYYYWEARALVGAPPIEFPLFRLFRDPKSLMVLVESLASDPSSSLDAFPPLQPMSRPYTSGAPPIRVRTASETARRVLREACSSQPELTPTQMALLAHSLPGDERCWLLEGLCSALVRTGERAHDSDEKVAIGVASPLVAAAEHHSTEVRELKSQMSELKRELTMLRERDQQVEATLLWPSLSQASRQKLLARAGAGASASGAIGSPSRPATGLGFGLPASVAPGDGREPFLPSGFVNPWRGTPGTAGSRAVTTPASRIGLASGGGGSGGGFGGKPSTDFFPPPPGGISSPSGTASASPSRRSLSRSRSTPQRPQNHAGLVGSSSHSFLGRDNALGRDGVREPPYPAGAAGPGSLFASSAEWGAPPSADVDAAEGAMAEAAFHQAQQYHEQQFLDGAAAPASESAAELEGTGAPPRHDAEYHSAGLAAMLGRPASEHLRLYSGHLLSPAEMHALTGLSGLSTGTTLQRGYTAGDGRAYGKALPASRAPSRASARGLPAPLSPSRSSLSPSRTPSRSAARLGASAAEVAEGRYLLGAASASEAALGGSRYMQAAATAPELDYFAAAAAADAAGALHPHPIFGATGHSFAPAPSSRADVSNGGYANAMGATSSTRDGRGEGPAPEQLNVMGPGSLSYARGRAALSGAGQGAGAGAGDASPVRAQQFGSSVGLGGGLPGRSFSRELLLIGPPPPAETVAPNGKKKLLAPEPITMRKAPPLAPFRHLDVQRSAAVIYADLGAAQTSLALAQQAHDAALLGLAQVRPVRGSKAPMSPVSRSAAGGGGHRARELSHGALRSRK